MKMKYPDEWTYKTQSILILHALLKGRIQILTKENARILLPFQLRFFLSVYIPAFCVLNFGNILGMARLSRFPSQVLFHTDTSSLVVDVSFLGTTKLRGG
jgi:hypothetical protein